jgi:hypothetical protein
MSISVSDDQVRLDILALLHKNLKDSPTGSGVDRAIIQDTLKLSENQMDINMLYLEDKTLVTVRRTISSQWTFAKITTEGIDVMENKERYVDKFPFAQTSKNQIHEVAHEKVSFNQQLTDVFNQAYDQVRATKLSPSDKEKIEKQLKALEKELQKTKKADLGAIQKSWEGLKKKASWLSPAIAQVILEEMKIVLDL